MHRKPNKRKMKLWARVRKWPAVIAYWILDLCEDFLVGCLQRIYRVRGREDEDWDD